MKTAYLHIPLFIFALLLSHSGTASEYSGTVVNGQDSRIPVPNVLVSVGYSQYRTKSDAQGRFSITIPGLSVPLFSSHMRIMRVQWNNRQRIFKLGKPGIVDGVLIYSLNGAVVFKNRISPFKKTVQIPPFSHGVYLVQFTGAKDVLFSGTFFTSGEQSFSFPLPIYKRKTSAVTGQIELLFRHDDHYPVDLDVYAPSSDLLVGMLPDPRAHVFDFSQIHSYYFTITQDDSLKMEKEALLENYIPAGFVFNNTDYGTVGLRYKGSVYSLPNCFDTQGNRQDKPECKKISLKVKFNKYIDSTRFYSMKELNVHSMSADGSKMVDMLSYEMFRNMGIYSPRTSYIKVYFNNIFQGLYAAIESIDGRFTKSRWPVYGDGNLYKEAWPRSASSAYFTSRLKTNNDPGVTPDVSKMINFSNAIDTSTTSTFIQNVSPFIDFDYFTRYIAVDRAIKNWDGITAFYGSGSSAGNHNYFFYEEENAGGKVWIIPWDLDNSLWRNDPYIEDAEIPNWNEEPDSCKSMAAWGGDSWLMPSNCDKFLKLTASTLWDSFVKFGEELLARWFVPDSLLSRIDQYQLAIADIIEEDPIVDPDNWGIEVAALKRNIPGINRDFDDYIHGRSVVMDTSDYSVSFPGTGKLLLDYVNNFEFTPVTTVRFAFSYSSSGTVVSLTHNTIEPLWGNADLLFNFSFNPVPDNVSYSEWAGLSIQFSQITDLTGLKEVRVNLKSDSQRYLWVYIGSPVYSEGGVAQEYGWFINVNSNNKIFTFNMDEIGYPTWADASNPDLLNEVISRATTFCFGPNPHFDGSGELGVVPDSGFLAIDNIKFVY